MNFTFSEEQEIIRDSARGFLSEHSGSEQLRAAMESELGYDPSVWQKITQEMGWAAISLPEDYGGLGLGHVELAILQEEMGRRLLCSPFFSTICLGANTILTAGTDSQKADYLPKIAEGALTAALANTEASGRLDASGIEATWARQGNGYVLKGVKRHILHGASADLLIVAAREAGSTGEKGIGLFLVPKDTAGLDAVRLPTMDQTRPLSEITLNDVVLPGDAALGDPGAAWAPLQKTLQRASIALAAEQVGGAMECLDQTVAYAKERVQFGRPIGSFQAVKHKCADMMVEAEAAKSAAYYAACVADEDSNELSEAASMAKSFCSEAFFHCAGDMIQLHGGIGFTWELDAHLYFKHARSTETFLGTPSYHREIVAQLIDQEGVA